MTTIKVMPTVIAALETSKLSHTVCCSTHHCSPAVFFCCKCWGDSKTDQDQACHQPGEGLCSAHICCCTVMNGASRSRALLKNQDHRACIPAAAHSVLAAIIAATERQIPSPQPFSLRSTAPASTDSGAQLIRTGHGHPDSRNCNYTARITWGREHPLCPLSWQIRFH